MRRRSGLLATMWLAGLATPAFAQEADLSTAEVIVTASRRESDSFDDRRPAIGLLKTADFAVQEIAITGDTRDPAARQNEIYATLLRAIQEAPSHGVELAFGETIVTPLTTSNYKDVPLAGDGRPDSNRASVLIKVALGKGIDAREAAARVTRFRKAVQVVGRALVLEVEDMRLSIVGPDKYRSDIAAAISDDARKIAAKFGGDYAVQVKGLNRPVEWSRAGLTEVFLYVPYELTITPKGSTAP